MSGGVILFSGGMDSVILAIIAKSRGHNLIPVFMSHRANVGNVTKKELRAASKLAKVTTGNDLVIVKPPTKTTPKWYSEFGVVHESDLLPVVKTAKDRRNRVFIDVLDEFGMADGVVALGLFGSTRVDGKERTKARADDIIPARISKYLKSIGDGTLLSLVEYDGPGGEAGAKERALKALPASAKKHVLASESCLMWFGKPCGNCWSCMDRVKSITAAWGKDTTPYRPGSKADKHKKGGKGRGSRGRGWSYAPGGGRGSQRGTAGNAKATPTMIAISLLEITERIRDPGNAEDIADLFIGEGWPPELPPVFALDTGEIIDGHHRVVGAHIAGRREVLVVEADADTYEALLLDDYPRDEAFEKLTGWDYPLSWGGKGRGSRGLANAPFCPLVDIVEFYDEDTGEIVTEVQLRNSGRAAKDSDPFMDWCAAVDAEEAAKKPKKKKRSPPKPKQSRSQAKTGWKLGDVVVFGRKHGEKTIGEIVGGIGAKKIKIRQLEPRRAHPIGSIWRVAPGLLTRHNGPRPRTRPVRVFSPPPPMPTRRSLYRADPGPRIWTHDLQALLAEEKKRFANGECDDASIRWSRSSRRVRGQSLTMGTWHEKTRDIRIHPAMDRPEVPAFVMRHLIFHELLHGVIRPHKGPRGRRVIHGPHFKRAERAHPDYDRAEAWTKKYLGCLVGAEDWSEK